MEDIITKRFHISGLTKELTLDHVKKRFDSIGQVVDFTPPGKNALGDDQNFAYLEVKGPQISIKKCVNGLSGATWNNSKLRIADAKPDWKNRLAKECLESSSAKESNSDSTQAKKTSSSEENLSEEPKKKKSKKLPKGIATESENISHPISIKEVKSGEEWGWKLTPAGHLIRPLVLRPDRPLPKAMALKNDPKVSSRKDRIKKDKDNLDGTGKGKEKEKEGGKKEKKSRKRKLDPNSKPPTRSNRITLDPTRYGSSHLSGLVLESSYDPEIEKEKNQKGIWVCQDADEDDEEGNGNQRKKVKWIHVVDEKNENENEKKVKEEVINLKVKPNPKSARSELFDDLDASVNGNSDFELEEEDEEDEEEEQMKDDEIQDSKESDDDEEEEEEEDDLEADSRTGQTSTMPPSGIPHPDQLIQTTTSTLQPLPFDPDSRSTFSEGYEENVVESNSGTGPSHDFVLERDRTKDWLSNVFGEGFLKDGKSSRNESTSKQQGKKSSKGVDLLVEDPEEDEEWDSTLQAQDLSVPVDFVEETPEQEVQEQDLDLQQEKEEEKKSEVPLTGAKARRAALLAPSSKQKTRRSFQPHARFDPGSGGRDHEEEEEKTRMEVDENLESEGQRQKKEVEEKETQDPMKQAQMTSLKDMFKPQEEVKGFSLLGGLDLDLDEELDFLADDQDENDEDLNQNQNLFSSSGPQLDSLKRTSSSSTTSNIFLFPKFNENGNPTEDSRNFLKILSNPLGGGSNEKASSSFNRGRFKDHDRNGDVNFLIRPKEFCRNESEEERKERWERNKKELTMEYKRRHREAVKKKRRKVEGGKVIPGR